MSRSSNETCDNCVYYTNPKCYRYPPTIMVLPTQDGVEINSDCPLTNNESWCGEYKHDAK